MKKKILQKLLLIGTVTWFTTPFLVAPRGQTMEEANEIIEIEVTTPCHNEENNWIQGWTTGVVSVKEEPFEESKILKVYVEYEPISFYEYDNNWVVISLSDSIAYINKNYVTSEKVEIEYRKLMEEQMVTKEWFIKYKEFINLYSDRYDVPETIYDCFTEDELDLLFRVVQAEIGDYSFEQRVNVANVIFNRIFNEEEFGNTIQEVLIPSQFCTIKNGRINKVTVDEDTILACEYAFAFPDTTNGALFFDNNRSLNYKFLQNDGAHNFYTTKERGE